jgi:formate hydrogenlyase subunit 6/NADH:ubiquinone oxidoreductase subunit I
MQKWVEVNFYKCDPNLCDPEHGLCVAAQKCKYEILEQEEPYEMPMHFLREMCIGCYDCVKACPRAAIETRS